MSRTLPKRNNPLMLTDAALTYEDLLARRRLGKTKLSVKPDQIGTCNATRPENLGLFEYTHIPVPLPKDLKGSEIFPSHTPAQHQETYYLMRRSKDGFVSATGMFKVAFPWAKFDEEKTEREYLKSREQTSQEEVARNLWVSPQFALELAREYKMYDWVRALLDPTDIVQKQITPPPKFELPMDKPSSSCRSCRSVSPSRKSTSRKARQPQPAKDVLSTLDIGVQDKDDRTALPFAAQTGSLESAKMLHGRGADISVRDKDGRTALHLAAQSGSLECTKMLLDRGADISVQDKDDRTALHLAAQSGSVESSKMLLGRGADISVRDKDGRTALHLAAQSGSQESVKMLLDHCVDIDSQDKDGRTALHLAAQSGSQESVKILLDRVDIDTQD
ncbi:hypothetical protein EYZ11_013174 [Aspergillus tanneri]|uniref:Cell pattern formation-associated protein stuA n=1 Tax=Aspergillus tanneri TaxID=1220188 RepID=A0A4S3IYC2_9EURO|nr:hypothetical protein EYZ11_013174 [Aspergillus tanneri]